MKWIKLLIIVISLSLPIHSYVCWDDDMDDDDEGWYNNNDDDDDEGWYNNNDDDDDYAWDIDLPDVIITADDDDSWDESDDDWWRTDYGDDDDSWDDSSDDDDDWWDVDDTDKGNWGYSDEEKEPNVPYKRYYEPNPNEHSLATDKVKFPGSWDRQDKNMNCVSTVLEYVANFFDNSMLYGYQPYRTSFEQTYYELFNRSLDIYGVNINQMSDFYTVCGFENSKITFGEIKSFIDSNYPIIATVKSSLEGFAHEVFVVSYTDNNEIVAVNPTRGEYQSYHQDDFYGNAIFVLKQYK